MVNWTAVLEKLLRPGYHRFFESDMNGHVLSAGESLTVFIPRDPENNPLIFDKSNPLWVEINKLRERIGVEICYGSALGERWTVRGDGNSANTTTETRRCPSPSATTFQQ